MAYNKLRRQIEAALKAPEAFDPQSALASKLEGLAFEEDGNSLATNEHWQMFRVRAIQAEAELIVSNRALRLALITLGGPVVDNAPSREELDAKAKARVLQALSGDDGTRGHTREVDAAPEADSLPSVSEETSAVCCENENRTMDGGCASCGAPSL